MVRRILIGLMSVLLMMQAADAADNKIIVQPITNSTGDENLDPLSAGFSDLLVAYLSGYEGLEILYREDLHKIWQELAHTVSGLDKTNTLKIGKLIQARKLIKGGFVKIAGSFKANVHVYDIESTRLQYSFEETGEIKNVAALAAKIAGEIANKLLAGSDPVQSQASDDQPVINTHFMKGLGYFYSGLYDHALAEFMQVIDLDPGRADARFWIGKCYFADGEHEHARIEYERFINDFSGHEEAKNVQRALDSLLER